MIWSQPCLTMPTVTMVSTESGAALGQEAGPGSATWITANRIMYYPFRLHQVTRFQRIGWANGTAVSGNVDAGVYDHTGLNRAAIGSTAQAGTSVIQSVALDVTLEAGWFYLALVMDNTTATVMRLAPGSAQPHAYGQLTQASTFPLPAQATFAVASQNFVPLAALSRLTVL